MDPLSIAVDLLIRGGPWAVTAFVAWAYLQKDKQQQRERQRTLELVEKYVASIGKLEGAVTSMTNVLNIVASRDGRRPDG